MKTAVSKSSNKTRTAMTATRPYTVALSVAKGTGQEERTLQYPVTMDGIKLITQTYIQVLANDSM